MRDRGAAQVEYVVLAVVIALGILFAIGRYGGAVQNRYQAATDGVAGVGRSDEGTAAVEEDGGSAEIDDSGDSAPAEAPEMEREDHGVEIAAVEEGSRQPSGESRREPAEDRGYDVSTALVMGGLTVLLGLILLGRVRAAARVQQKKPPKKVSTRDAKYEDEKTWGG